MGELKKISDYSDSAMHWSPREALEDALADLDNPETEFDGVLIIKVQRKMTNSMHPESPPGCEPLKPLRPAKSSKPAT